MLLDSSLTVYTDPLNSSHASVLASLGAITTFYIMVCIRPVVTAMSPLTISRSILIVVSLRHRIGLKSISRISRNSPLRFLLEAGFMEQFCIFVSPGWFTVFQVLHG